MLLFRKFMQQYDSDSTVEFSNQILRLNSYPKKYLYFLYTE